jgi:uncharacterized protein (TIGR00725 family)
MKNKNQFSAQIDLKFKLCVSGAAETSFCKAEAMSKAMELGKEIVRHNAVLIQGATTGFPLWAAKGAKEAGGFVVGVSPAPSEKEHVREYNLPLEYTDIILYTGFGYSGRNLLLTRMADAVIVGCGRMGTVNEFTIAFEDKKPIGVLEGDWETDELIKTIVEKSHRAEEMKGKIIYSREPEELVNKIIELIHREKSL